MLNSPYDPEAREHQKRATVWTGSKVHLSETGAEDLPLVVTQVSTTPAPEPDGLALAASQAALVASKVAPGTHLVDQGDVDGENLVGSEQERGMRRVGPVAQDTRWQAKEGGVTLEQVEIDWGAKQVRCPGG